MTKPLPPATTVADFIADRLAESGKTQRQVAEECGFEFPNIITMFKKGQTKLPLDRIGPLAKALNADPAYLLRLAIMEYMPSTWASIEETLNGMILTANELELVRSYRQVTGGSDAKAVVVDRDTVLALVKA